MARVDKSGITRADIERLLPHFYASVRRHPRLGPIFASHIGTTDQDWAPHMKRIGDFWANVMLKERAYDGNPLKVHLEVGGITEGDFDVWLTLFDQAAGEALSKEKAAAFSVLAHRIGRSLRIGVMQARGEGPPRLF